MKHCCEGGFNPKKPKTTMKSHFGFELDIFKDFLKSYENLLAHCNVTLVDFKRYFGPFKICLG